MKKELKKIHLSFI